MGVKRKTDRREHETPKRCRFKSLIEEGHSQSYAAEAVGVHRITARKWASQGDRRTRTCTGKKLGRPPKVPESKVKAIIKWFTGHHERRVLPLQEIAQIHNITATDKTLRDAFARYGYHYHPPDCKPVLSKINKTKRWLFSIANWDRPKEYWRKGFYTDETTVNTAMFRRQKVLRKRGERQRLDCIQFTFHSGRKSVSCWAAIGYNYKSQLYFIAEDGTFTQQKYESQILRGPLQQIFKERIGLGFFCVEDGSRVHGRKDTKKNRGLCNRARVECHINTIQDWPPSSFDLNPIENIWRVLKQLLRNRKPLGGWSIEQLKEAILDI